MSKWRIMVVDDEPDVRAILRGTLKAFYEVVEAHDGLDALEKLVRHEPDFVIMDVMMPLMDGFEACASIRKNARFNKLPVMFLTALGSKEDMKKGYGAGANLYLTKPFDPERLLKNIEVFFRTTPPVQFKKRYTIEELEKIEKDEHAFERAKDEEPAAIHKMETGDDVEKIEVAPPAAPVPAPAHAAPPSRGAVPRVMVVDDDPDIIDLMEAALSTSHMAEVVRAMDGIQAIERLVKYQPDMLVIDVMLPKMSGFQLCQSLRANRAFSRMPILICSAKGAERDKQFAMRVGANDYLVKPFQPQELIDKIQNMMKGEHFKMRPKTYTIFQIKQLEAGESADIFRADESTRNSSQDTRKKVGDFLATEGKKSPTKRDDEKESPDRKKLFFGFGKK